jgi:hypothetical protein
MAETTLHTDPDPDPASFHSVTMEELLAVPQTRHSDHHVQRWCRIPLPHPALPNPAQPPFDSDKRTVVLGSNEPPLDTGHRGIQCCTFHLAFLILENLFSPYLQVVISLKNYFLFTPLLPSVAVGTLHPRSIIQPTQYITWHKSRNISVIEA